MPDSTRKLHIHFTEHERGELDLLSHRLRSTSDVETTRRAILSAEARDWPPIERANLVQATIHVYANISKQISSLVSMPENRL